MTKHLVECVVYLVQVRRRQQLVEWEFFHQLIILMDNIRSLLESGVCDEANGSTESLCITETFHNELDFISTKLSFDAFQRALKTEPKIDLLRGSTRGHIACKLCDALDRFDPSIHVCLESVKEKRIVESVARNKIDMDSNIIRVRLWGILICGRAFKIQC